MAQYTAIFTKPYEDGYENLPSQNTPITAETLNDKDNAIVNIETYLSGNDIPSDAEGLSYDNTDSGLTATDVQSAIDEIVTDIPTVNNGTLTIQKNGTNVATFSANQSSNATANIQVVEPDSTIKTNTSGQFDTVTGGLLDSCVVDLTPKQDLHGYSKPWVGGAGKNKVNSTLTTTTQSGVTYTALGDGTYNLDGTASTNGGADFARNITLKAGTYKILGIPSDVESNSCYLALGTGDSYYTRSIDEPFTLTEETTFDFLRMRPGNGKQFDNVIAKPMITTDLTATYDDFEPYANICGITGHSSVEVDVTDADSNTIQYTISLGQTVYGGSLDVVSGVLTIDRLFEVLDGSEDEGWSVEGTGTAQYFFVSGNVLDSLMTATPNPIYNKGVYATIYSSNTTQGIYITGRKVRYRQGAEVSLADFKTSLSNEPLQVCYYISTPITIQLTPQQIETLIGENNVSVPLTGQSLDELTYREMMAWDDVEKAINVKLDLSSVAPIEYTDNASQSYNQKQLFIKDNKLCQALASISSGASFTENTNFKYTTLAEIIEPLIP